MLDFYHLSKGVILIKEDSRTADRKDYLIIITETGSQIYEAKRV
jgi:hypothetical protein